MKKTFLPFNQAINLVPSTKCFTKADWHDASVRKELPDGLPAAPDVIYRGSGWISWNHWFEMVKKKTATYAEAKAYARKLYSEGKVSNFHDWKRLYMRSVLPAAMPSHPHSAYKNHGWAGYPDFFGRTDLRKRNFLPFQDARKVVQNLGISGKKGWVKLCQDAKRPENIPSNPDVVYGGEWKGWKDFIGKSRV